MKEDKIAFRPDEVRTLALAVVVASDRRVCPPNDAPLIADVKGLFLKLRNRILSAQYSLGANDMPQIKGIKLSPADCAILMQVYTVANLGEDNFDDRTSRKIITAGDKYLVNIRNDQMALPALAPPKKRLVLSAKSVANARLRSGKLLK